MRLFVSFGLGLLGRGRRAHDGPAGNLQALAAKEP